LAVVGDVAVLPFPCGVVVAAVGGAVAKIVVLAVAVVSLGVVLDVAEIVVVRSDVGAFAMAVAAVAVVVTCTLIAAVVVVVVVAAGRLVADCFACCSSSSIATAFAFAAAAVAVAAAALAVLARSVAGLGKEMRSFFAGGPVR
jgi:hypothetical protein